MKTVVRISGILITRDGLLLVKCDGIDDYLLPGGKLEPGESDLDALRRGNSWKSSTSPPGILNSSANTSVKFALRKPLRRTGLAFELTWLALTENRSRIWKRYLKSPGRLWPISNRGSFA